LLRRPGGLLYLALKGGRDERWVVGRNEQRYFFAYYQPDEVETLLHRTGFRLHESWSSPNQAGYAEPWLNFLAVVETG
jgi:hypothetical protein